MWSKFMKDCAFYFDVPTIEEENAMKKTLQRKYDTLLTPGWRAPLTSRRDLLGWACRQVNANYAPGLREEGKDVLPCENHSQLLKMFGPNYDLLKGKLGHVRGLFD